MNRVRTRGEVDPPPTLGHRDPIVGLRLRRGRRDQTGGTDGREAGTAGKE
ncbi:hypothetical protein GCM10023317_46630 [Actinopolymorpha pittospori]